MKIPWNDRQFMKIPWNDTKFMGIPWKTMHFGIYVPIAPLRIHDRSERSESRWDATADPRAPGSLRRRSPPTDRDLGFGSVLDTYDTYDTHIYIHIIIHMKWFIHIYRYVYIYMFKYSLYYIYISWNDIYIYMYSLLHIYIYIHWT